MRECVRICVSIVMRVFLEEEVLLSDAKCAFKQLSVKSMQSFILPFALLHINPLSMAFYLCYINLICFFW